MPTSVKWLSTAEAHSLFGITDNTITAMIRNGSLEAIDVSISPNSKRPTWRISQESLERFIEQRTIKAKPTKPARVRRSSSPRFYS